MTTPDWLRELEALEAALPWPAPWVTRPYGVECPKADDCGEDHECVEVESPDAYPDGQCVSQVIDCPGMETFARPTAAFIAAARNALPVLLRIAKAAQTLRDLQGDGWGMGGAYVDSLVAAVAELDDALSAAPDAVDDAARNGGGG